MAVIENRELRRMEFKLTVEDDWPPVSVESLWVVDSGERRFTIDNAPFFVTGIAVGDLVSGEERSDGLLQFSGKIEGGGHSTIQVIVVNDDVGAALKGDIQHIGCDIEVGPWSSLFSIDIPDGEILAAVHQLLGGLVGDIEYVNACIAGSPQ